MKNFLKFFINLFALHFGNGVDLTCSATIDLEPTTTCGDVKYAHPVMLLFAKPGQEITAVGAIPTAAEVATAMALATIARVIVMNPISDGKITVEPIEIQNYNDLPEKIHERATIEGMLKYLDDALIDSLRQLSIHKRLQFWFVDAMGRFYGAKAGYAVTATWGTLPTKDFGFSTKAAIPVKVSWNVDSTVVFTTAVDPDYLDLDNS